MKSLSLSKPLMILVIGRPGAGKSFFARQFSATFGAPVVSYDTLRSALFTKPTYNSEEQQIIDRIARYQAAELLKTKRTFLIDGGCNVKVARLTYAQAAKPAGYNTLVVWVQTDETTCRVRATRRTRGKSDGTDQPETEPLTDELFNTLLKRITEPSLENYVVISGKHTYPAQLRAVLKKLVEPREVNTDNPHKAEVTPPERPAQNSNQLGRNIIVR